MVLASPSSSFQSLPPLPTSKLGPSSADFWVGGFVYILGLCESLQQTLLWGWEFLLLPQPPQIFTPRGFEAFFSHSGTLSCPVCLAPQLFLPVYLNANVRPPGLPASPLLALLGQQLPCPLDPPASAFLILSALAVHLCLSSQSKWMFLLLLLGCRTSIQFNFLAVLVIFLHIFVFVLLFVVRACKVYLPMPPSWSEVL